MSNRKVIVTDKAPKAKAPLSQAVVANGMVYVSGTTPFDLERKMASEFPEQMHQVMKNMKAALDAAGSSLKEVVKVNVFLTDIKNFAVMNEIYATYWEGGNYPARTTIEAPMAVPNMMLEIECTAVVSKDA